jgi:plasmid replication initiation protein
MEKKAIAQAENTFIFNAQFKLPAREHKLIIYLISKLNPQEQEDFFEQSVPITELLSLFQQGEEYKSFYEQINTIIDNMLECKIKFPTKFEVEGKKISKAINWFQMCEPVTGEDGLLHLKFTFSHVMKPFLLELKEYVRLNPYDLFPMRSNYAIRMYEVFKAERDRLKWAKRAVVMQFSLEELRGLLGLRDEYRDQKFAAFRRRVLDVIRNEINANSPIMHIDFILLKDKNKVVGIEYTILEKNILPIIAESTTEPIAKRHKLENNSTPLATELATLTKAKKHAFDILVAFGVFEGIAYKQLLPSIKGSELMGFEDMFVTKAIQYFEKNALQLTTPDMKAATFVKWWHNKKIFDVSGDTWALLLEQVVADRKALEINNPEAYDNRLQARTMTQAAFYQWYDERKNRG